MECPVSGLVNMRSIIFNLYSNTGAYLFSIILENDRNNKEKFSQERIGIHISIASSS
jgi:hypothetical protein